MAKDWQDFHEEEQELRLKYQKENAALRTENATLEAAVLSNQEGVRDLNNTVLSLRSQLAKCEGSRDYEKIFELEGDKAALLSDNAHLQQRLTAATERVKALEEAVRSVHDCIVFSAKDWSLSPRYAWIYGIVVGWGDDSIPGLAAKFRWTPEDVATLRKHRAALAAKEDGDGNS